MAAKTYDVAEDEDKMMEPEEVCDNLEIVEPAIPSTSSANNSSSHFKMLRREAHVDDVNDFDNIELTFPSTSTARYRRWPRFRMLQRADAIQEEDEDEIESNGHDNSQKSIQSAIPSTSISASHSISYHSLIRERNYLKFEIDNIGKVMKCCKNAVKRWLSVIDDEAFPEEEYLQEYIEGTNTLHELQRKEMELVAKQEKILELVKLRRNKEEASMKKVITILIVHLPNNQHTSIQVQKGLTLRNAVSKAMQRRHLIIDDCAAYIKHRITSCFISWDTDISTLQCKEVFVETLEAITVPVYYLHHFARNTFLNIKLSYCYFCEKSVLYGFHCKLCDRKYHMKCVAFAPILCEHIKRRRAYYERLLANNMTTGIIQIRARPPPTPSSMAKKRRENQENPESSTSLPNVAINLDTEVSKTKDEIFKTKDEVSKTKEVVFKIKDGVSKPKDGVSKTKDELSKTKDGISKARVGVFKKNGVFKEGIFKTKDGIFKTKSEVSKTKDLTVIQEDKKNTEITVKKRKQKKHEKSTNENDLHVDDIERKKSNDSEDSIFSHQDSINDFKIIAKEVSYEPEKIGQGTYGSVYKGDWHGPVAVKRLNIEVPTAEQIRTFKNEVNILRKIRHKHVLLFMGCICKPYLAIITQWCEGQSLHHRLHVDEDPLEMITIVIILKQTSEGMDYLHARNIHHRDLKSYNIFFHNGLHVKIGDFGLAVMRNQFNDKKDENEKHGEDEEKEKDARNEESEKDQENEKEKAEREKAEREEKARKEQENKLAGSIPWMAPEVLRMKEDYPYSFQSDVYSFGIVMFELFAREIPYGLGADPLFILYNVGRGNLAPDSTKMRSDTPRKLKVLYKQCIAFEKDKRPLFPYILKQVYSVFRATPKIRRTTSLPLKTDELADTYIERDEDVQDFLTSDDDYEAIFCSNTGINAISSVTAEDIFADF
ncbi:serine/threonine-protein kinase A-Raf [Solenopsis invicta]|uniref:serine/threonine-protein kinase A-Raf n=1 Tax=Solenopsis invicta TaxID=13686 RepID=UPI0005958782|nr:serine/threonine-protein kinase A-Raf [Solenopsis invicta]XP_011168770.1 serine/threonine-protein kinase A-Raf [Solenopsis invicta]XP_025988169.1 serine/threonine-protein kinase A-Raf [Solenopsis invicta]XP_025988170.1 serine/threonine-protein kinase A-Raf [Solenopsis invicta]XP_025988171.1 serine/threonine-protein kinase A-Raf [Solenopsis invicta]XP_039312144.1 serine/threonine-protein kinase A-Raf [Solenopsis invicta]XP_039312149.1 serine/threonine-protein kinase A-Raf [Solenopsis invict